MCEEVKLIKAQRTKAPYANESAYPDDTDKEEYIPRSTNPNVPPIDRTWERWRPSLVHLRTPRRPLCNLLLLRGVGASITLSMASF
jgi:hypothetical protein